MSAESDRLIAELDSSLATDGEDVELRRLYGNQLIPVKVTCRAFVRNFGAKDLVGSITQDQSDVIMSPTEIIAAGWPGPWTPSQMDPVKPDTDRRVPRKGDKCVIQGKARNIEVPRPIYVDNELVRIELRVLG